MNTTQHEQDDAGSDKGVEDGKAEQKTGQSADNGLTVAPSQYGAPRIVRIIFQFVVVLGALLLIASYVGYLLFRLYNTGTLFLEPCMWALLPVTVGLPIGAILALVIVLVLEVTSGQIEFAVSKFTFTGASGPIVLWVLCFLTIAFAIYLNWPKGWTDATKVLECGPPIQDVSQTHTPSF